MNTYRLSFVPVAALVAVPIFVITHAQSTPPVTVVEEVITEERVVLPTPPAVAYNADLARRQLGTAPRALPVPEPAAGTPSVITETSETVIDEPGQPTRVYYSERSVVVVDGRELPFVTLPVLFKKETAELLEAESRLALEDTAAAIREVLAAEPDAVFDVEGHTSIEGEDDYNMDLSAKRARRVYEELTRNYSVPASALSAHGYGENYANYPEGPEENWVLDRRVLVVRVK